jgi:glycosyltransferase involved in cell wall biosynthesis
VETDSEHDDDVRLSLIAPAHDEQDNVRPLVDEVEQALGSLPGGFEFIVVDDGSRDETRARLLELASTRPWLRVLAMTQTPPGSGNGQSSAFHAGIRAARGSLIALIDADLQNDPADLPKMVELLDDRNVDFVQGDRSANRRDNIVRRASSWVGRFFRRLILGDSIRDTGCSLRVMKTEIALRLPLEYRGMHRFIPVTARQLGYEVIEMPAAHRPRTAGVAKYGVWNRAIPGLIDCFAVRWMRGRRRPTLSEDCTSDH